MKIAAVASLHSRQIIPYFSWVISITSLIGSLYFSEVRHFAPCTLCWWQRVFMYPLVLIIPIGIIRNDTSWPYYALPLSLLGGAIALYQNLLVWGIIPEKLTPCSLGISCATTYIEWLGFISIPLLSLLAFTSITIGLAALIKFNNHND